MNKLLDRLSISIPIIFILSIVGVVLYIAYLLIGIGIVVGFIFTCSIITWALIRIEDRDLI
jgi:hypothetical protein